MRQLYPVDAAERVTVDAPVDDGGRPAVVLDLERTLDLPRLQYDNWFASATGYAGHVIALRESDPTASRVAAWRKHARDGTLPPALLWWIRPLQRAVLLDGHDRLRAAAAEGVVAGAVVLWQERREPFTHDPRTQAGFRQGYEAAFARDDLTTEQRARLNRLLMAMEMPGLRRDATTRGHLVPDLDRRWEAEVSGALPDDVHASDAAALLGRPHGVPRP